MSTKKDNVSGLPVTYHLTWVYLFSLLVALLTAVASIAGILYPNEVYPTAVLGQEFVANDVINLVIGLPILLLSMWLTRRGRLLGLLFWPGAIFYGVYNYTAYLFGAPFSLLFPLHLLIVTLSIYLTIALVAGIDGRAVQERLDGRVPVRFGAAVLAFAGIAFGLRSFVIMVTAPLSPGAAPTPPMGVLAADVIVGAAWIIGGVLLWQRRPLGFVGGTGLLFQTSMLFIGVIAVLLLQPLLYGAELLLTDIFVLVIMGLLYFVPFVLFVRGVAQADSASQ